MILTGKAADSFLKYLIETNQTVTINYEYQDELIGFDRRIIPDDNYTLLLSKIIEWLDSVGIYIEIGVYPQHDHSITFIYSIFGTYGFDDYNSFDTRQQATEEAIKTVNKIYNKKGHE